ncbi:Hypothetical predicted protein, partial [Drosophila guanche]
MLFNKCLEKLSSSLGNVVNQKLQEKQAYSHNNNNNNLNKYNYIDNKKRNLEYERAIQAHYGSAEKCGDGDRNRERGRDRLKSKSGKGQKSKAATPPAPAPASAPSPATVTTTTANTTTGSRDCMSHDELALIINGNENNHHQLIRRRPVSAQASSAPSASTSTESLHRLTPPYAAASYPATPTSWSTKPPDFPSGFGSGTCSASTLALLANMRVQLYGYT